MSCLFDWPFFCLQEQGRRYYSIFLSSHPSWVHGPNAPYESQCCTVRKKSWLTKCQTKVFLYVNKGALSNLSHVTLIATCEVSLGESQSLLLKALVGDLKMRLPQLNPTLQLQIAKSYKSHWVIYHTVKRCLCKTNNNNVLHVFFYHLYTSGR